MSKLSKKQLAAVDMLIAQMEEDNLETIVGCFPALAIAGIGAALGAANLGIGVAKAAGAFGDSSEATDPNLLKSLNSDLELRLDDLKKLRKLK